MRGRDQRGCEDVCRGRERAEVFTYVVDPTASSWGAPFFCCSCSPIRSPIRSPHPIVFGFYFLQEMFRSGARRYNDARTNATQERSFRRGTVLSSSLLRYPR